MKDQASIAVQIDQIIIDQSQQVFAKPHIHHAAL